MVGLQGAVGVEVGVGPGIGVHLQAGGGGGWAAYTRVRQQPGGSHPGHSALPLTCPRIVAGPSITGRGALRVSLGGYHWLAG